MYEVAKARLSTGAGAEPRTTFEKKVSILRGEVYFLDKDLLMRIPMMLAPDSGDVGHPPERSDAGLL